MNKRLGILFLIRLLIIFYVNLVTKKYIELEPLKIPSLLKTILKYYKYKSSKKKIRQIKITYL